MGPAQGRMKIHVMTVRKYLTEVYTCFSLSCKANARVKLAKTGHGPHSSTLVVICVVLCIVCVQMCTATR